MRPAPDAGFGHVIAAEVVSNFGSMMSRIAIPWLAVLTLGANPWQMGLLAVADRLAGALTALAMGIAIDRLPKRSVMVRADVARSLLLALLALAATTGRLSFALLVVVAAAGGVLDMAFELARSAWIAQAVPAPALSQRNAQLSAGAAISESLAFAITGVVFQWLGGVAALLVDGLSYLASALLLRRVGEPEPEPPADGNRRHTTLAEALRLMLGHPALRALAALDVLVALSAGVGVSSYMIYVSRDLALSTGLLGLVFALGGAGSAIGAALAPRAGRRLGHGRALAWGLAAAALGSALVPLAGSAGAGVVLLLAAHQLVGDAGQTGYAIHDRTLRQTLVPSDALARVDAAIRTLGQCALVAGALGGGAFATGYGTRGGLWLSAALLAAAALLAWAAFGHTAGSAESRSID